VRVRLRVRLLSPGGGDECEWDAGGGVRRRPRLFCVGAARRGEGVVVAVAVTKDVLGKRQRGLRLV